MGSISQSVSVTHVLAWTTGHTHSRNTGRYTRGVVCLLREGHHHRQKCSRREGQVSAVGRSCTAATFCLRSSQMTSGGSSEPHVPTCAVLSASTRWLSACPQRNGVTGRRVSLAASPPRRARARLDSLPHPLAQQRLRGRIPQLAKPVAAAATPPPHHATHRGRGAAAAAAAQTCAIASPCCVG